MLFEISQMCNANFPIIFRENNILNKKSYAEVILNQVCLNLAQNIGINNYDHLAAKLSSRVWHEVEIG
jgi:hypothetical protein